MPKSKRSRRANLTAVKPKTRSSKEKLINSIEESVNIYQYIFLFRVENMRNQSMKEVRDLWKGSRFFMGKTSVMRRAFENSGDDKQKTAFQKLCSHFAGEVGLFFTDSDVKKVTDWFASYRVPNYAKAGFISDREFKLPEGPLPQDIAPFSIEPQLRKLGLPTRLRNGIVELSMPVTVCQVGDSLTPEQCRILQLFDQKFAEFQLKIIGMWDAVHGFQSFETEEERQKAMTKSTQNNSSDDMDDDNELAKETGMMLDEDTENKMNEHTDAKIDQVFNNTPASASSSASPSSSSSSSSSSSLVATPISTRQLRSHGKVKTTNSSSSSTPYAAAVAAKNSAKKSKTKKGKRAQNVEEDDMDE